MSENKFHIFTGDNQPNPNKLVNLPDPPPWRDFSQNSKIRGEKYVVEYEYSQNVIDMVNTALYLRRPLLVTGKAGTGKSSLAYAIAYELGLGEVLTWAITSKSLLKDALYSYDAVARLQDAALKNKTQASEKELVTVEQVAKKNKVQTSEPSNQASEKELIGVKQVGDAYAIGNYIRLGPLGMAFRGSVKKKPRVLLIDEIDKSDIDLPNDLLHIFEEGCFEIPELLRLPKEHEKIDVYKHKSQEKISINSGSVRCEEFPLVIMTSNGEREFPAAFLRRCLRLNMELPSQEKLIQIVEKHLGIASEHTEQVNDLLQKFIDKRDSEKCELATDQLLNAVYLLIQGLDLAEKEQLRESLFKSLTEEEI